MRILLTLIIPALLILAPAVWQIIFTIQKGRKKTHLSLGFIFLIALGAQPILTLIAFYTSMYGLGYGADGATCVNGSITFLLGGVFIACIVLPVIFAAGATVIFSKH